ncbi:hypothetical protein MXB02_23805 [Pseudomonas mosselii]|nr:hypothetical protein MXB02_23805 [Pseudomonas mosselii]
MVVQGEAWWNRPLESDPRRNKLMDNLLREYAGTHYQYDDRGNLIPVNRPA